MGGLTLSVYFLKQLFYLFAPSSYDPNLYRFSYFSRWHW
jgi:hypothetical protein